ncbi:MAG: nitrile hydratase subunit alpha [Candidatus Methylumidiphilus sp.]
MTKQQDDLDAEATTVESRRNFLKSAGVAGLAASTTGVGGVVGVAALGVSAEAEAAQACGDADEARADLGGAPIFDDATAFSPPTTLLSPLAKRADALKQLVIDKKIMDFDGPNGHVTSQQVIEGFIQYYHEQVGPYIGKAVVAHAWVDPAFKDALLNPEKPNYEPYKSHPQRGPFAAAVFIGEFLKAASEANPSRLSFIWPPAGGLQNTPPIGPEGNYVRVVANGFEIKTGQTVHNMVSCTLCSCYPQALLGVQPVWYKSRQYRARSVSAPRGVMLEFAESKGNLAEVQAYLNTITELRVWDSNSEVRFFVIPEPPKNEPLTYDNEMNLATLVTRNGMIGTELI